MGTVTATLLPTWTTSSAALTDRSSRHGAFSGCAEDWFGRAGRRSSCDRGDSWPRARFRRDDAARRSEPHTDGSCVLDSFVTCRVHRCTDLDFAVLQR